MMTAKEKAKELIKRYYRDSDLLVEDLSWIQAKECALIAVDEILAILWHAHKNESEYRYWQQVKSELESF